ncbi:MAG: helicase-related protein [Mycobacteriaceae bacterium]
MSTVADHRPLRDSFVLYVRRQLVGPFGGADELIADTPNRRYLMGILFPRSVEVAEYVESEGEQAELEAGASPGDESLFSDDSLSAANDFLPASQGLSFFTSAEELTVTVRAAWYETLEGAEAERAVRESETSVDEPTEDSGTDPRRPRVRRVWQRHALEPSVVGIPGKAIHASILDGRAMLHARWRPTASGALVTVTVVNSAQADTEQGVDRLWDQMLLQVEIDVQVKGPGSILEYPSLSLSSHDEEEEELRLQHRDARTFAIGHGCAVRWDAGQQVNSIHSEVMPTFEVPQISAAMNLEEPLARQALDIAWLADDSVPVEDLHKSLAAFVAEYRAWLDGQRREAQSLLRRSEREAAGRILGRVHVALGRMKAGAEVLSSDPTALRAFRLANRAMLRQMRHSAPDLAGARHRRDDAVTLPTDYPTGPTWRGFQLGFVLLSISGMVRADDPDRDVVDLIWFPTGGGKTEAYLLLASFEIFRRRLTEGEQGAGTAVISRYTLTLLTTQQFQRAATTICALEDIRRGATTELGSSPISIGLWVGDSMTPNRYSKAREAVEELKETARPDNRFLLERCPWCGTEVVPRERSEQLEDYGINATDTSFSFRCTNARCSFQDRLPVHVVDDDLYDHPPTFLLGTVDKFAGLAWEPRAGAFFGRESGHLPPTLVIQDELHLLTGPLGTTVGVYEAAIQRLCEHKGRHPKVVSSTATIRRARDQVLGLFGRTVQLFPPPGLSADDSHFAAADRVAPGRLYVGVMAQGHTADTATVHSVSALMQAPYDLELKGAERDVYWTLVAYHSSLRELGRTVTIARDDVPSRLRALIRDRPVRQFEVDEITSNVERSLQPELLERLNRTCEDKDRLDFVASTNMLSVGVDVPRLGLMLVNGQPKATAEYIQATSRVGRSAHPGLVFGLFRATRPRDRSHYENFRPYHAALYRYVEPTSVTPWSPASRMRALHAALVILVRHHLGLAADDTAGQVVDNVEQVKTYIEALVDVVLAVEPREASRARAELERFLEDWIERADRTARSSKRLYYKPNGKGQVNLLRDFNAKGDAWPTLRSMRNVDKETLLEVMKAGGGAGKGT